MLEKELRETKSSFFEVEIEVKKLEKELKELKLNYLELNKPEDQPAQKENLLNGLFEQKTIKGGGFLFKKQLPRNDSESCPLQIKNK